MIQRIQTLFLTIGLVLMGLLFILPLGNVAAGDTVYSFTINGIVDGSNGTTVVGFWYLLCLSAIIVLLQLVSILLFKKRVLQSKLAICNLILMIGFVLIAWLAVKGSLSTLGNGISSLKLPLIFPIISAVLNYLASRAIKKDEALVRSVDRIR